MKLGDRGAQKAFMLTVLMVLQPAAESSVDRSLRYGLGTILGVVASLLVFVVFGVSSPWAELMLLVLLAGMVVASQIDYGLQTAFSTGIVLTLMSLFIDTDITFFGERLLDVMAGVGIALTIEYAIKTRQGDGAKLSI